MTRTQFIAYVERLGRLADALIQATPEDHLDWRPAAPGKWFSLRDQMWHLAACFDIFAWVCAGCPKDDDFDWVDSRDYPQTVDVAEARDILQRCLAKSRAALAALSDEDFRLKPVASPSGWFKGSIGEVCQMYAEHQTNEKMRLFCYLKMLGVPVDSRLLYTGEMRVAA